MQTKRDVGGRLGLVKTQLKVSAFNMQYGTQDATFQAAGGEQGVRQLVDDFYNIMASDSRFDDIYRMHPAISETIRDKLHRFLCGWMGGPKLYHEKYGSISIPGVHRYLEVNAKERDQWLACMQAALDRQPYEKEFKAYLITQLSAPAEMIRKTSGQLQE